MNASASLKMSTPTKDSPPRVTMLVGVPGAGKSTWTNGYLSSTSRDTTVISTDDLIEEYAAEHGLNYSEAFEELRITNLEKIALEKFRVALENRHDVIIDRTNLRVKSRNRFLSQIPKHYLRFAVVFNVPEEILLKRLADRDAATGKHIPMGVFKNMLLNYEAPTLNEFDLIEVLS